MPITWYSTASLRLDIQQLTLLFDPFAPLPAAGINLHAADFLPAPHILITHGHLDHLSTVPALLTLAAPQSLESPDHPGSPQQPETPAVYASATPCSTLVAQGVDPAMLNCIKPDDKILFSAVKGAPLTQDAAQESMGTQDFDSPKGSNNPWSPLTPDVVTVNVRKGRHIRFDARLVLRTLFNPRLLRSLGSSLGLLAMHRAYPEKGETLIYEVSYADTLLTVMGSLALAEDERYTQNPDLLVLPYQGQTHLQQPALAVVEKLMPRAVLLDHFDNSFPPISRTIDPSPFINLMAQRHPQIRIIVPQRGVPYTF